MLPAVSWVFRTIATPIIPGTNPTRDRLGLHRSLCNGKTCLALDRDLSSGTTGAAFTIISYRCSKTTKADWVRVPAIVVPPFAKRGYVTRRIYSSAIVRLIEDNWTLGRLSTTDRPIGESAERAFDSAPKAALSLLTTPY